MPFEFWRTHSPVAEQQGAAVDVQALHPKLSVRISDELHMRLKMYAVSNRVSLQALVLEALEDRLNKPIPPPKPKLGARYRAGEPERGGLRTRENGAPHPLQSKDAP